MADNFFKQFTDEEEPNFFEQFTNKPPSGDSDPVVETQTPIIETDSAVQEEIDPAVQEEINNRKLLIDIVGIDPNTGEFVVAGPNRTK